jgi:hypothetical protein
MLEVLLGMSCGSLLPLLQIIHGLGRRNGEKDPGIAAGITCQFAMLRLALPVVPSFRGKPTRVTTAIGRYFPS